MAVICVCAWYLGGLCPYTPRVPSVCLYVCMDGCVYVCVRECECVHTHTPRKQVYIHFHLFTHKHTQRTQTHANTRKHSQTLTKKHTKQTQTHTHTHVHARTHAHAHTLTKVEVGTCEWMFPNDSAVLNKYKESRDTKTCHTCQIIPYLFSYVGWHCEVITLNC